MIARFVRCFACLVFCLISSTALAELEYELVGVDDSKLRNNIRLHLNSLELTQAQLSDPFWQQEVASTVATAVEPFGYYNSQTRVEQPEDEDEVILHITLDTPLQVTNVTREIIGAGRADKDFRQTFNSFALKPGDVMLQPVYERFKSEMFNYALEHGYFDFHWQATRLDLVREERAANILLIAQSGPRYVFGEVTINGDDKAAEIIGQLRPFKTGEPYTSEQLTEFNRRLNQTGYFSRVIARPVVSQAQGTQVPIEVTLAHQPRDNFNVGLGAATDTGARLRLKWERPWVNASGHSVNGELFLSAPEQSLTLNYLVPMKDLTSDYLKYEAGYQLLDYNDTGTESQTLSLSVHRLVQDDDSPWQTDYSATYLRETYQVQQDAEQTEGVDLPVDMAPEQTTQLVLPGYALQYLTKDAPLNITHGNYLRAGIQVGRDGFGSDIDIVKITAEAKFIRTFGKHRFMLRAETGAIDTNSFTEVPASLRFYAGGDQSVRGFGYREIAPDDDDIFNPATGLRENAGAKYLATAGTEYAYRVADKWRAAAFFDIGTATNEFNQDPAIGVGPGAHWLSPIGPVRFYIARGFSQTENTWRFHFMLGPEL